MRWTARLSSNKVEDGWNSISNISFSLGWRSDISHHNSLNALLSLKKELTFFPVVENFIKTQLPNESYKPLWLKPAIFVTGSNWCSNIDVNAECLQILAPEDAKFKAGVYDIAVIVSHLSVKMACSLSLFVTKFAMTLIATNQLNIFILNAA